MFQSCLNGFRNLYLTEYLRHHPDTTAQEFKVVWDTLVQAEVKQVRFRDTLH